MRKGSLEKLTFIYRSLKAGEAKGQQQITYLTGLYKWMAEQVLGGIVKKTNIAKG